MPGVTVMRMAAQEKRVVLVTGASSGIGRACAELLAARGHCVYGAARRKVESDRVTSVTMDVRDEESVRGAVQQVLSREGRIDAVVNNAGIAMAGAIEDTAVEEARELFETNFFGAMRVCRAVLPAMRERGAGHIVNIGSIAGLVAVPYAGLYSASKFALEGLSEALRMEAAPFGVRVVLIEPGDHRTPLTESRRRIAASEAYRRRSEIAVARMEADERNGPEPEAVARLVLRVINKSRPRLRYATGPLAERAAIWLKRLAPYAVVEKTMDSYYSR